MTVVVSVILLNVLLYFMRGPNFCVIYFLLQGKTTTAYLSQINKFNLFDPEIYTKVLVIIKFIN